MQLSSRLLLPLPLLAAAAFAAPAMAEQVDVTITCPDGSTRAASFDHQPTQDEVQARGEQLCGGATGPDTSGLPADAPTAPAPEGSTVGACPKAVTYRASRPLTYFDGTPVGNTLLVDQLVDVPSGAKFSITHNGVTWASTTAAGFQFDSSCVKPAGGTRTFAPYLRGTSGYLVTSAASAAKAAVVSSDEAVVWASTKKTVSFTITRKGIGATTSVRPGTGVTAAATIKLKPAAKGKKTVTLKPGKLVRVGKAGVR